MAESWPRVTLGETVDLLSGFAFKSAEYGDAVNGTRLLRGDNVVQRSIRWDGAKYLPTARTGDYQRYLLAEGDVVLAMDRPWIEAGLKVARIRPGDAPSLLVQRVARLRATGDVEPPFLPWVLYSQDFTNHVLNVQTGTAVPHISAHQIREYSFRLPPTDVQRGIAGVLGALDDLIDTNQRLARNLRSAVEAKHGLATRGAAAHALGGVLDLKYGKSLPARSRRPGSFPVVSSAGIVDTHDTALVSGPGVVVGRKGSVGTVTWVEHDFFPIDTAFYVETDLPPLFVYLSLRLVGLGQMNTDSAVPGLNRANALSRSIAIPGPRALARLMEETEPLWDAAHQLGEEADGCRTVRDELLPLLLSGRVLPGEVAV